MFLEFSPIFGEIKEYNDIQTLVDFVLAINNLMSDVDDSFTVQTFFGSSLANIYQQDLSSDVYVQRGEILKAKISFQKVISIS